MRRTWVGAPLYFHHPTMPRPQPVHEPLAVEGRDVGFVAGGDDHARPLPLAYARFDGHGDYLDCLLFKLGNPEDHDQQDAPDHPL